MEEKLPLEGVEVTIQMAGKDSLLSEGRYVTDKNGNFVFSAGAFDGKKELLLMTDKDGEPLESRITLDRQISPPARMYPFSELENAGLFKPVYPESDSALQASLDNLQYLSEVKVEGKKVRRNIVYEVDKEVTYYKDKGMDMPYETGHAYLWHRDKNYARGESHKTSISYKGTPGAVNGFRQQGIWKNETSETLKPEHALFFRKIEEIERIEIIFGGEVMRDFRNRFPHRFERNYILILVTPFEKEVVAYTGTRYTYLAGYSLVKEFYRPDYANNPPVRGEIDYRRTLYWEPNVKTDIQGTASVDFFNNASCRELIISAEGISSEGEIVQYLIRKEVEL